MLNDSTLALLDKLKMTIGFMSNSTLMRSGYANQTQIFSRLLKKPDQDNIMILAFRGIEGSSRRNEDGVFEVPRARDAYMNDIIQSHFKVLQLSLVFTLIDVWALSPAAYGPLPWTAWLPIDSSPIVPHAMPPLDVCRWPMAMSRHGERELINSGFKPLYVPHGVDSLVFKPLPDRKDCRQVLSGLTRRIIPDDCFLVVEVAANGEATPTSRKNFSATFRAWRIFHEAHPDSLLYLHTDSLGVHGEPLLDMAAQYEVADSVLFPPTYDYNMGRIGEDILCDVYNAADVHILLSKGEGFGIPCFPPGARVSTVDGIKAIEALAEENQIVTHTGNLRPVTDVMRRQVNNEPVLTIRLLGNNQPIRLTTNHPLLAVKRQGKKFKQIRRDGFDLQWTAAGELNLEDFVFLPRKKFIENQQFALDLGLFTQVEGEFLTSRYSNSKQQVSARAIAERAGLPVHAVHHVLNNEGHVSASNVDRVRQAASDLGWEPLQRPGRHMPLTEDTGFIFGQYIAQGSGGKTGNIEFDNHVKKTEVRARLIRSFEQVFGFCAAEHIRGNCSRLTVCCQPLAVAFHEMCGKGARNKHLPFFTYDNVDFARGLLIGMWSGDGCFSSPPSYSTSSEQLAYGVRELLSAFGFFGTIAKLSRGDEWNLTVAGEQEGRFLALFGKVARDKVKRSRVLAIDGGWLVPIRSIENERYTGLVYNLEVAVDHSYCVEGIAAHNCIEAQMCGCPVIQTDFAASSELCLSGWKVGGHIEEHYPLSHQLYVDIDEAAARLTDAYNVWKAGNMSQMRKDAAERAMEYDAERVLETYMLPALLTIQDELARGASRAPAHQKKTKPWSKQQYSAFAESYEGKFKK